MRKVLLIIMLFALSSVALAIDYELKDYYAGTGSQGYGWMAPTGRNYVAMSFTTEAGSYDLDLIQVRVKHAAGSIGGLARLHLYAASSGVPTTKIGDLNVAFSDFNSVGTTYENVNLTLTGLTLANNTEYALVWNGTAITGANKPFHFDSGTAYTGGQAMYSNTNPTGWNTMEGMDQQFFLFTEGAAPGENNSLNISSPFPSDGTQFNTELLNINFTVNSTFDFGAQLYVNGVLNQTVSGLLAGTNVPVNWNLSFAADEESTFTYNVTANNSANRDNSTTKTFHIDNVLPSITWTSPANDNTSVVKEVMTTNIFIQDPNLFSYRLNITFFNGTSGVREVYQNTSNSTLTGLTNYTVTDGFLFADISKTFTAQLKVCDGHTDQNISIDDVEVIDDTLIVESVDIELEDKTDTEAISFQEEPTKISFDFDTFAKTKTKEFIVEAEDYIQILDGTEFPGHLVLDNKYWMDWDTEDLRSIDITRLAGNKVSVVIEKWVASDEWDFESIGELNCREQSRTFFVFKNNSMGYDQEVLIGDTATYTLNLTYNSSITTGEAAYLNWNGTRIGATYTNTSKFIVFSVSKELAGFSSQTNITNFWSYNISGSNYNTSNFTQTLHVPQIDDCSSFTNIFANFTILDEDTNAPIANDNTTLAAQWNYGNDAHNATYNSNASNQGHYTFCMSPLFASFSGSVDMQYDSPIDGYVPRDFTSSSFPISSVPTYVNLFLLKGSTAITIHVVDENDDDLQGIVVKAYKHDLATGNVTLVETESTDMSGTAILNLAAASTFYSLALFQDGIVKINTSSSKLFLDSYDFVIKQDLTNTLANYLSITNQLTVNNLTYSNSTNILSWDYAYTGSDNVSMCLTINANDTTVYSQCGSTPIGTLNYTVNIFNLTYSATATGQLTNPGSPVVLGTLVVNTFTNLFQKLGSSTALFIVLILFLTFSLIGLVDKSIAIAGGMLSLIATWLFGLLPATLGWTVMIGGISMGALALWLVNRR
tara:strand:+ start:5781 stop:8762 length:2982 start_codon:yes stop_codon:yes gene_type:complete